MFYVLFFFLFQFILYVPFSYFFTVFLSISTSPLFAVLFPLFLIVFTCSSSSVPSVSIFSLSLCSVAVCYLSSLPFSFNMLCIFALFCASLRLAFFSYRFRHVLFLCYFLFHYALRHSPPPLFECVPCPLFLFAFLCSLSAVHFLSACPFSFSTLPSFLNMSPVRCSIFTVSICLTYLASFSFLVRAAIIHCPLLIPFCSIFSQNDSWPFSSLGLRDPFPVHCSLSFRFVSFPGFAFVSDLSLSFFTQRCSIISLLIQCSPFVFKN
jgi:hypothetical protein